MNWIIYFPPQTKEFLKWKEKIFSPGRSTHILMCVYHAWSGRCYSLFGEKMYSIWAYTFYIVSQISDCPRVHHKITAFCRVTLHLPWTFDHLAIETKHKSNIQTFSTVARLDLMPKPVSETQKYFPFLKDLLSNETCTGKSN